MSCRKFDYEYYKDFFKKNNCILLNTKEEYEIVIKSQQYKKFRIKYECEHILENCYYHMFKSRASNNICRVCYKSAINKVNTLEIESNSIKYLRDIIGTIFDIIVCVEGCKSDIIIRLKNSVKNKWLPIQLKATLKSQNGQCKFKLHTQYDNMILICISIDEKKQWLFEDIPNTDCINIGKTKNTKYKYSEIEPENLVKRLVILWCNRGYKQEYINLPISEGQKTEQKYKEIRSYYIDFLNFETPERNQMVYDFKIRGKKVQEKTASKTKNKAGYTFGLKKNNGSKNKKRLFVAYSVSDNDFYWFNLKDTFIFYVIPAELMLSYGYLNSGKSSIYIIPESEKWYNKYKFNYENIDKQRLLKLFDC